MDNKCLHDDIAHNNVNRSHAEEGTGWLTCRAVYRFYYKIPSDNLLGVGA